jgi:hypothetical protein
MKRPLRVGLLGIGLDTYWSQFKGLKPRLESCVRTVQKTLARPGTGHIAEKIDKLGKLPGIEVARVC